MAYLQYPIQYPIHWVVPDKIPISINYYPLFYTLSRRITLFSPFSSRAASDTGDEALFFECTPRYLKSMVLDLLEGFQKVYFRRFTLLAASRVRICVIAMVLSLVRRSDCGIPWRMRTEFRLSRFVRTTSCSNGA